jgi:hypothetical protein
VLGLADTLQKIFLNFSSEETISNAVTGLGFVLPMIEITAANCFIW